MLTDVENPSSPQSHRLLSRHKAPDAGVDALPRRVPPTYPTVSGAIHRPTRNRMASHGSIGTGHLARPSSGEAGGEHTRSDSQNRIGGRCSVATGPAPKPTRKRTALIAARVAAGYTQETLAARIGVERSTVYR